MSKYASLLQPVFCEWVFPDSNSICGANFSDVNTFTVHVRTSHLQLPSSTDHDSTQNEEHLSGVCHWNGCNYTTLSAGSPDFHTHVLYHPYHSYLKLLGSEVQEHRKLSSCQIDSNLSNLLPLIEVELQCQWNEGQCGVVFDSIGEFYRHVHDHVMSVKQCFCCWGGKCLNLWVFISQMACAFLILKCLCFANLLLSFSPRGIFFLNVPSPKSYHIILSQVYIVLH